MKIEFSRYSGYESPHDYDSLQFSLIHGEETDYYFRMGILVYRGRNTEIMIDNDSIDLNVLSRMVEIAKKLNFADLEEKMNAGIILNTEYFQELLHEELS